MKTKVYKLTGRPTPSCLAFPHEERQIRNLPSVAVELICTQLGRTNRRKLDRILWSEIKRRYGHLRIGGYTCGHPEEHELSAERRAA